MDRDSGKNGCPEIANFTCFEASIMSNKKPKSVELHVGLELIDNVEVVVLVVKDITKRDDIREK